MMTPQHLRLHLHLHLQHRVMQQVLHQLMLLLNYRQETRVVGFVKIGRYKKWMMTECILCW